MPSTVAETAVPFSTVITTVLVTASSPSPGPFTVNVYVPSASVPVVVSPFTVTFFLTFSAPLSMLLVNTAVLTSAVDPPATVTVFVASPTIAIPSGFLDVSSVTV